MKPNLALTFNKIPKEKKNKLIAELVSKHSKLEKSRLENKQLIENLSSIQKTFNEKSKETLSKFIEVKEAFLKNLIEKSKNKSLTKWQQDILGNIIRQEYDLLLHTNCMTENAQKMMADYQKSAYEMMSKTEKMMAEEMLNRMKSGMDLPDDFDLENMHDPEYLENMQRKMHEKEFEQENRNREKEIFENQQNINLDFKQIYRKLAKFSHPDLAKTKAEKAEKEELIKRINTAWKEQDYYELIIIWMEVDPDNEMDVELSENNCKEILQHLASKIKEVEYEKYVIKNEDPKTAYFYQNFYAKQDKTIQNKIEKYLNVIKTDIHTTQSKNKDVKTISGLKKILTHIDNMNNEKEDFLDMIDKEFLEKMMRKMKK